MATSRFLSDVFAGTSYGDTDKDFHIITTDDPWMIEIGLGSFTTGVFQEWWDTRLGDGSYPKRNLINITNGGVAALFFGASDKRTDYAHFTGWRANTKKYTEYKNVTHSDTSLNNWSFKDADGENPYTVSNLGWTTYQKYQTTKDLTTAANHTGTISSYNGNDSVLRIIEANNQIRIQKTVELDETKWSTTVKARSEFVRDVKSSTEKCVTWTKTIPFVFNVNSKSQAIKYSAVTFKMYLFDEQKPRQNARKIAMSDFTIVGSPIDALGITYNNGSKVNGEFEHASAGSTAGKVGAKLRTTFDETSGFWESGTTQIVARILTDIEACTHPNVDAVFNAKVSELVESTNANYTAPATGLAMPIYVQNGNPMQWAPNYKSAKGCRKDEKKQTVPIVNIANRTWAKGDVAVLNYIHGVWIPSAFGDPTESDLDTGVEGGWDFTYLMTNTEYFFRDISDGNTTFKQFSYSDYEASFYALYYNDPTVDTIIPQSNRSTCGYYQVTSWDFMGPTIGGNRVAGNALAQTQFALRADETAIDQAGKGVLGTHSAPFFGCVFPDGYDGSTKYSKYKALSANNIVPQFTDDSNGLFFSSVVGDDLFANSNVNKALGAAGGMFVADNSNLKHLPADIALNASPNGDNGRPISNIVNITDQFSVTTTTTSQTLQTSCNNYFESTEVGAGLSATGPYAWMYIENNNDLTDRSSSLFDLAPQNSNKIEFRPLKTETYAAFEHTDISTTNPAGGIGGKRGEFGATAWEWVDDASSPISNVVLARNNGLAGQVAGSTNQYESPSKRSLRYGYNDAEHMPAGFKNTAFRGTAKFPSYYWDSAWTNSLPASAIGVIGAVCTVKANTSIQFDTECYIGMASTYAVNAFYPSWGGGSNDYKDVSTTQLYARIFQSWPRELTVYDHRFFAVHHFNYGAGQADTPIETAWYDNGTLRSDSDTYSGGPIGTFPYPTGTYGVDQAGSDVDIRIPTWMGHDGTHGFYSSSQTDKTNVDILTVIFNGAPLRDKDDWNIPDSSTVSGTSEDGVQRRGKLLPYPYIKNTIGITSNTVTHVASDTSTETAVDADIMVINAGTNYGDGDTFTASGGSGFDIILIAHTAGGTPGPITSFTVSSAGRDYSPDDFLKYDDILNGQTTSNVEIVPTVAAGSDFKGYIVKGMVVYSPSLTDEAPQEAVSGPIQLTPNPPVSSNAGGEHDPVLDENRTQTATIENASSNRLYDVYFHFHNDISHSFADSNNSSSTAPSADEQMVRLEMTLT